MKLIFERPCDFGEIAGAVDNPHHLHSVRD